MIEHLRGRDRKLEPLGWTGQDAEWIALWLATTTLAGRFASYSDTTITIAKDGQTLTFERLNIKRVFIVRPWHKRTYAWTPAVIAAVTLFLGTWPLDMPPSDRSIAVITPSLLGFGIGGGLTGWSTIYDIPRKHR